MTAIAGTKQFSIFLHGRKSRLEQMADILRAVESGEHKPTRIMYKTTIAWNPLHKKMAVLINAGLLEKRCAAGRKCPCYYLTSRGREFLRIYKELETCLMSPRYGDFSRGSGKEVM